MNSIEDVYNRLLQVRIIDNVDISLLDDKETIQIMISASEYIIASEDMVEINRKKKIFKIEYWTSTHWHPSSLENLLEKLSEYLYS